MAIKTLFTAAALCALLSACATTGPSAPGSTAQSAAYRDNIDLRGRLAVNYQNNGKNEALSGTFTWKQTPARIDVALASPFSTIATISVTPGEARLTQSGQPPRVAADIDALTAQALGWSLPVAGLRDWLQGYATGADGKRFIASPANDSVTTRDGWRLRYVSWQDAAPGGAAPQPRRIDAERSATLSAGELSIRIVIDAQEQP
jgi:outer membrane lipoprotein LolB